MKQQNANVNQKYLIADKSHEKVVKSSLKKTQIRSIFKKRANMRKNGNKRDGDLE